MMMLQADQLVTMLTLLGGGALGAALGGCLGGVVRWSGGKLHVFIIAAMAAGAGVGFTYGAGSSAPGYVDAAEARVFDFDFGAGGADRAVMRVLRNYYPGDYAGVATDVTPTGPSDVRLTRRALDRALVPVIVRETPMADTSNAIAMLKLARREQKTLMSDPMACWRAMHGARVGMATPASLRDDEMRLTARLLTQTALAPQVSTPRPDVNDRIRRLAGAARADLTPAERKALAAIRGTPTRDQAAAACRFGVKLYDAILMSPDEDAAAMFKGLFASGLRRRVSG